MNTLNSNPITMKIIIVYYKLLFDFTLYSLKIKYEFKK